MHAKLCLMAELRITARPLLHAPKMINIVDVVTDRICYQRGQFQIRMLDTRPTDPRTNIDKNFQTFSIIFLLFEAILEAYSEGETGK